MIIILLVKYYILYLYYLCVYKRGSENRYFVKCFNRVIHLILLFFINILQ